MDTHPMTDNVLTKPLTSTLVKRLFECTLLLKDYEDNTPGLSTQLRMEAAEAPNGTKLMMFVVEMRQKLEEDDYRYMSRQIPAQLVVDSSTNVLVQYALKTFNDMMAPATSSPAPQVH
jgi:hypothetical protein